MTIVILVSALVLLDLFRLAARRQSLTRTGVLIGAVVRAVIPLAAAIPVAVWRLIASFEGIAATGSGGLNAVAAGSDQVVRILLTGVIGFAIVLVIALVLVAGQGSVSREVADARTRRQQVAGVFGTITVIVALGVTGATMNWTNNFGVGLLGPMLGPGVAAPPTVKAVPPPPGYTMIKSGYEMAMQSERLITSRAIGIGLCVLLVAMSAATTSLFSGVGASGMAWNLARGGVAALVIAAVGYSVHLGTAVGWLRVVIDR